MKGLRSVPAAGANERASAVFVCPVALWSSVMSLPEIRISIKRLAFMSEAQLRALDDRAMGKPPAPVKPKLHIEIDDIPNAAKAALVSMSFEVVAKAVTERLKASTVRFGRTEFTLLRELGLCERQKDTIYHRLTEDGKGYARIIAGRISRELGMHVITTEIRSFKHEVAHCSCGWMRSLYSGQSCQRDRHIDAIAQHLAEAAGAPRKTYPDEALKRAIAAMDETFRGDG
jgi:hypothetical protein